MVEAEILMTEGSEKQVTSSSAVTACMAKKKVAIKEKANMLMLSWLVAILSCTKGRCVPFVPGS